MKRTLILNDMPKGLPFWKLVYLALGEAIAQDGQDTTISFTSQGSTFEISKRDMDRIVLMVAESDSQGEPLPHP